MTNIPTKTALGRGYAIAVTATVIWSTTAIFIGHLTTTYHMPPFVLACWREGLTALVMLAVLLIFRPRLLLVSKSNLKYLVLYGLILAIFNTLWTFSVKLNGASVATMLSYCSPGFTVVLAWWLLKEELNWGKIIAAILSLLGCALVSGAVDPAAWRSNLLGIITGICSGLFFAFYTLMGRSANQRGLNPWGTLFYTFGFAGLSLLVVNLVSFYGFPGVDIGSGSLLWLGADISGWVYLLLLIIPTIGGYGLYSVSLGYLPSGVANLIVTMEPAFTAILAYLILAERMSAVQVIGSVLVLSAVIWLRVYEGWKNRI